MHKKAAICVLAVTAGILVLSIYMLFFGKSGFINADRKTTLEIPSDKAGGTQAVEDEANAEKEADATTSESLSSSADESQEKNKTGKVNTDNTLVLSMGDDTDAARILPQSHIQI